MPNLLTVSKSVVVLVLALHAQRRRVHENSLSLLFYDEVLAPSMHTLKTKCLRSVCIVVSTSATSDFIMSNSSIERTSSKYFTTFFLLLILCVGGDGQCVHFTFYASTVGGSTQALDDTPALNRQATRRCSTPTKPSAP